jgi:hypothetical protein
MSTSIALVCEGPSDLRTVCPLADRVIAYHCSAWIDAGTIGSFREYRGFRRSDRFLSWREVRGLARQHRAVFLGHFEGVPPLHHDAHRTREAIILLTLRTPEPAAAIILVRDGDQEYEERRAGILHARDTTPAPAGVPVVVGVANRMRECWVLAGFVPGDDEQERWAAERQRLGFDPCAESHELTASDPAADRSPKRVLAALVGDDHGRERECMTACPLDRLKDRGGANGLKAFIEELETRLVTAFR